MCMKVFAAEMCSLAFLCLVEAGRAGGRVFFVVFFVLLWEIKFLLFNLFFSAPNQKMANELEGAALSGIMCASELESVSAGS